MAKNAATGSGTGNQVVGKVFIIYGTVKAVAPDGTVRLLAPNSPVFADEKIITDSDGSVSLMLDGTPPIQLDLGRMTEIVLDQDVYGGATPEAVTEATAEAQQIQETLQQGDQPIQLEATAAGGAAGAGGAHPVVIFGLTGEEVTPGSGAGTTGITTTGVDTLGGVVGTTPTTGYNGVVTLAATDSISEDGGTIIYTATVDNVPQGSNLLLTLNNGSTITIPAGEHTGSTDYTPTPDPDVYVDPGSITGDIVSAQGGGYTQLTAAGTATTLVLDTLDVTKVTIDPPDVNENADGVTFHIQLSNPPQAGHPATVDVLVGETLHVVPIAADGSGSLFIATADPDVYNDAQDVTATVTAINGGNFEATDVTGATFTVHVTDVGAIDTTTVTLNDVTVSEADAGTATITASLDHTPQSELVVTLNNGATITFGTDYVAGTDVSSTAFAINNAEDVYKDGSSFTLSVDHTNDGGNFENLDTSDTALVTVNDTTDTTTITLSATPSITEAGTSITYTATLTHPADAGHDVTVTLSNGETITIAGGTSSNSVVHAVTPNEDVYVDPTTVSAHIDSATGGNFENLAVNDTAAVTSITDTIDVTTAKLAATASVSEDADVGSVITYTATLYDTDGNVVTAHNDVTVTLSNEQTITIHADSSSGTVTLDAVADTFYLDEHTVSASITGVSEANAGQPGAFESLTYDGTATVTTVMDDQDVVMAKLAATASVSEDAAVGSVITYTATLYDADGNVVTAHNDVTVSLSNEETITIAAGSSSGTVTLDAVADTFYLDEHTVSASITGVSEANAGQPGAFESLTYDGTATVTTVMDDHDVTTVDLASLPTDGYIDDYPGWIITASVDNAPQNTPLEMTLSNGSTITIAVGETTGTSDPFMVQDGGTISITNATGGNYEALDTSDTVIFEHINEGPYVDVTAAATFTEGEAHAGDLAFTYTGGDPDGDVTYSLTGDNAGYLEMGTAGNIVLTQAGAAAINADVPISSLTAEVTVTEVGQEGLHASDSDVDTVAAVNDAPMVEGSSVIVSEEGLLHGIPDTSGYPTDAADTTNATTASGTITIDDPDSSAFTVTLRAPTSTLTSGTETIVWEGDGTSTLVGHAGSSTGATIVTIAIDNNGGYDVTLSGPIDHPNHGGEDVLSFSVGVNVSDGVDTTLSSITVNVEDDMPTAVHLDSSQNALGADTNLMIILDDSGSMGQHVTVDGVDMTKLAAAKLAIGQLFDTYDAQGDVMVKLVAFNSSAHDFIYDSQGHLVDTEQWLTIAQANDVLSHIQASGTTNYDAALTTAMEAFDDTGKIDGAQNVSYFLSDGEPNQPSSHPGITTYGDTDANNVSINEWTTFLTGGNLTGDHITSFALGMGSGATQPALDPIAYDGVTGTDTDAIVVDEWSDLSQTLVNTLHALPVSGGLGASIGTDPTLHANFGADGGHVQSITVDSETYTYHPEEGGSISATGTGGDHGAFDTATNTLTVTLDDGEIAVDMDDGHFTYTPPTPITGGVDETIGFTLIDNDGDTSSEQLHMLIDDPNILS